MQLSSIIADLTRMHGPAPKPPATDPFELILWENIAYLVDDGKRRMAFDALRTRVGLSPSRILAAKDDVLLEVASLGGMRSLDRVHRLRDIARIAIDEGDLTEAAGKPVPEALGVFKKFPWLGVPGAERILLFSGHHPIFALESNGLRVLTRLGIGTEEKSYAKTYQSVRRGLGPLKHDPAWLTSAHLQLRKHGQEICRRSAPGCEVCVLRAQCAYARKEDL
jgi:endonuclease III